MKENGVSRFVKMYDLYYDQVSRELRNGRKDSHWMWFIFPQIKGLGHSDMSKYYGLSSLEEARSFLDSSCGTKMQELLKILLNLKTNDPESVFGYIDAIKLASSMTLFAEADPENPVFDQVLNKFNSGRKDEKTLNILNIKRKGDSLHESTKFH